MRTKNKLNVLQVIVTVVLILSFLMPTRVFSQAAPAPTPNGSSFDQRLAQRKAERGVVLDDKDQKRIVAQCTRAQGKVRTLQQTTNAALNNRTRVNQQIDAKLWVMIGKLKIAEKDTFNLEKQRLELAGKVASFDATGKLYKQSLDDLVAVNCQADPAGFKALLDTARVYRGQLRDQSTDIRNYALNNVKPTLSDYASQLQIKPSTEDNQ